MDAGDHLGSSIASKSLPASRCVAVVVLIAFAAGAVGCSANDSVKIDPCLDRSTPLSLAQSYESAARRFDFKGVLGCIATKDRAGVSSLAREIRAWRRRLPNLLGAVRERFGAAMARDVRQRMPGSFPSPFEAAAAGGELRLSDLDISDQGDRALYRLNGQPVAKAILGEDGWFFVADDDEYGRWLLPNPMAEAMFRDASKQINRIVSKIRDGSMTEDDVRRELLE